MGGWVGGKKRGMTYATRIHRQARAYVRWHMPTVCALATTQLLSYQAPKASRTFSAASLELSAIALEPSPNSYFVLPVASRIIRWAQMGGGTVSGVQEGTSLPPPPWGASWLGAPSAARPCSLCRFRHGQGGAWRGAAELWVGIRSCASWCGRPHLQGLCVCTTTRWLHAVSGACTAVCSARAPS